MLAAFFLGLSLLAVSVPSLSPAFATTGTVGWLADVKGHITPFGGAPDAGDLDRVALQRPVIAVVDRPVGKGYWMAALDGGVFGFGGAPFYGSAAAMRLNAPVVGMAATISGRGYWLVGSDGGIFGFGDAHFYGSLGSVRLNRPIASMTVTPSGRGYWLVGSDGGVFGFGDARFYGSLGSVPIAVPIATIASTHTGRGYWLLDRTGGIRGFGDARLFGAERASNALAVGIVPTPSGSGYWIATADGTVHAFGDASAIGSVARSGNATVGIATPSGSSSGIALPLIENITTRRAIRTSVATHEVALTFDDGPSAYTAQVLAVLLRAHVPATFFTIGQEVAAHPDLVHAEIVDGMAVGDHTWDHHDLTTLPVASIDAELRRTADAITAASGRRPGCFRPPYGRTNRTVIDVATRLGLTQILWNVDPSDYLRPGPTAIATRVLNAATGRGLIVILHDGGGDRSQTVAALPAIINGLHARGYTFIRLC